MHAQNIVTQKFLLRRYYDSSDTEIVKSSESFSTGRKNLLIKKARIKEQEIQTACSGNANCFTKHFLLS